MVEPHAPRGERVEVRRVHAAAVARQVIAPELVAHDEQHVADSVHRPDNAVLAEAGQSMPHSPQAGVAEWQTQRTQNPPVATP